MEDDETNLGAASASTTTFEADQLVESADDSIEDGPGAKNPLSHLSIRILAAVCVVGIAVDQAFRHSVDSLITSTTIAIVALLLFASGDLSSKASKVLVTLAPVFGAWLTIRNSSLLLSFDIVAAFGLLVLGTGLAKRGRFFDYRMAWLVQSTVGYVDDSIMAVPYGLSLATARLRGHNRESRQQVFVGLVIAAPILLGVGTLLAEADGEFAALFGWFETSNIIGHLVLFTIGVFATISLLVRSNRHSDYVDLASSKILAPATSLVIVLGFVALYGLFVGTQVVGVVQSTHTDAEVSSYARSGFFQLLWVAIITLVALMLVPTITAQATPRTHNKLRWASIVAIALTLVITAMSVRRLIFYVDVFGFTMLRLYSIVAAVAIGAVFLLLAARLWGIGSTHDWFVGATISTALTVIFALNILNPEAFIAHYNTQETSKIETIDMDYLARLSTDAIPTLVAALEALPEEQAEELAQALCQHHKPTTRDALGYNHSVTTANNPLKLAC
ncbi:MAG: DUF4173 domain-containing protein [Acidimicrobiales bacterium]